MFRFTIKWIFISSLIIGAPSVGFYFTRTHLAVSPEYMKEGVASTEGWSVTFGQDVRVLRARLIPEIPGKWYAKRGLLGTSSLTFMPESGFVKGEMYVADIAVARVYGDEENVTLPAIKFLVAPAPGVLALTIDEGRGKVLPRPVIEFVVDGELFQQKLIPSIVDTDIIFDEVLGDDGRIVWRPKQDLPQGAHLILRVVDEHKKVIIERNFETVAEPAIEHFYADEPVLPGDTIKVSFNVPMLSTSTPIAFDAPGDGRWLDPSTYEYTIREVSGGRSYTAKLFAGTHSREGGVVLRDDVRTFAAPGSVVASFSEDTSEYGVQAPIEISFNQPVDHTSAEQSFHLSPAAQGTFSWHDEKLVFTPKKLLHQKKYVVSLASGIKAKFGLPSAEQAKWTFTTVPEVYQLNVPYFSQEYSRSCEAASLRMALGYYGIETDDMAILQKIGYDPRPKDKEKNEWDDPHEMFVGDASKDNGDGYGVYREPVARAAKAYGRTADSVQAQAITSQFLAENVRAGYPIVLWGYTSLAGSSVTKWRTTGGEGGGCDLGRARASRRWGVWFRGKPCGVLPPRSDHRQAIRVLGCWRSHTAHQRSSRRDGPSGSGEIML